ncbi:AAA family ATPase [Cellulomonas sp. 179-A 4D5 NHS]|uniref:ATP-dependent nuclease n=1 Tax=Cellulomonas sp. 179-A 4D5 NHS TaxID=3142378 RepID=UPI0039A1227A
MVRATFELSIEDLAVIEDLDVAEPPKQFVIEKRKNGTLGSDALPHLRRNGKPFELARTKLSSTRRRLHSSFNEALSDQDGEEVTPNEWAEALLAALEDLDSPWTADVSSAAEALADWLDAVSPRSRNGLARDAEAAQLIRIALEKAQTPHPREVARNRLVARVPKFVLFADEDRALSTTHLINDAALRSNPQPALANLLRIARLDLEQLWVHMSTGDDSSRETLVEGANERLQQFFTQAWNQSNVCVRLKAGDQRLEVFLKELGVGGPVTNIEERSDGLRTFVALAAFLASQALSVPPVLLIDEAETHLHYDAQADLVGVLLKQVNATQIFYTTHSPGCLPGDLGTGIRLLRKDDSRPNASVIKHDFWTNEEPGFAPLLYAMGASAAAFSACRRAVLAEGAADMILLPTLIRMATGVVDLDYQVAPGLSNAYAFGMRVEEIAAQVVYLTDGDRAGARYREQLAGEGVDASRIFALPQDWASEDLIQRHIFLDIVNAMLPEGARARERDLASGVPVAKALEAWGKKNGVRTPGHVAIAYGLVNRASELEFSPGARESLEALHEKFGRAFA